MTKKQIEMILAIKEFENMTKAADSIGVAQPTLSRFLSNTEKNFKVKIFYRHAKRMLPTEEGEILLEAFKNILEQYRQADQKILSLRNEGLQELSFGVHQILGKLILPKLEKKLELNKGINLNYAFMNSRKVTEEVVNGNLDLGITADPLRYPDLVIKQLWKEYVGLYSEDGNIKETILYNSNMLYANKTLKKIDFQYKKKIDDYAIIYSILKRSTSTMGLLPNPIAESENKLNLIKKFQPSVNICLIYNSSKIKTKAIKETISLIQDSAKI